jgi:hypothetical protein
MPLGRSRVLLVSLLIYILSDILLTPLGGLETRPPADVTTVGLATLGMLFLGLALGVVSLVLLFYRPRRSPLLAIAAGILYFPAFITEQAGYFSSLKPPIAIETLEILQPLISLATMLVASAFPEGRAPSRPAVALPRGRRPFVFLSISWRAFTWRILRVRP